MITFTYPGAIATKGSTRAFAYRRKDGTLGASVTADNPRARWVQDGIGYVARAAFARVGLYPGGVAISIDVYLARPVSVNPRRRPLPTVKPDVDKIARLVLDALTGVAYVDDAAVCTLTIRKRYADARGPRVVVVLDVDRE